MAPGKGGPLVWELQGRIPFLTAGFHRAEPILWVDSEEELRRQAEVAGQRGVQETQERRGLRGIVKKGPGGLAQPQKALSIPVQ